jgi:hypothetical protein
MPDNEHQWVKDGKFPTGAVALTPSGRRRFHRAAIGQLLQPGSERQS